MEKTHELDDLEAVEHRPDLIDSLAKEEAHRKLSSNAACEDLIAGSACIVDIFSLFCITHLCRDHDFLQDAVLELPIMVFTQDRA